jgi:cytochrome o ubiquinol oxidase subunit 2
MPAMVTRLALKADHPGTFAGLSANFSGNGFADMRFDVDAVTPDSFNTWVASTRASGSTLDANAYAELLRASQNVPPFTYRAIDPHLFESIANPESRRSQAATTSSHKEY